MSLLRLLAAGKSLVGMRDGISPYRMCTKNLLPNFGATRNPFSPGTGAASIPESAPARPAEPETMPLFDAQLKPMPQPTIKIEPVPVPVRLKTAAPLAELPLPSPKPAPVVEEKPAVLETPAAAAPSPRMIEKNLTVPSHLARKHPARKPVQASGFTRWMASMNPASLIARWGKMGAGRPARSKVPEQAELLLAKVKPLRNELNDSDLEIVSTSVNTVEAKTTSAASRNSMAGLPGPWNRLTSKLFRTDHVEAR